MHLLKRSTNMLAHSTSLSNRLPLLPSLSRSLRFSPPVNTAFVRHVFIPLNQTQETQTTGTPHSENSTAHNEGKKREITIYIKGFLAKGETPEEFGHWFKCHQELAASSHGWGPTAHGYYWKAGHPSWDKYLPYGTLVYSAFNLLTKKRIPLSPAGVLGIAASEAALVGGRLWYEFRKAHETACTYAPTLAKNIAELSNSYEKIRCVAHSLGCVLLLESIKALPQHHRPHEVHLLAPALTEEHLVHNIAQEHTYLYHCDRDLILGAASALRFLNGRAVGEGGPKKSWAGLTPIDVSDQLGFFVHKEYRDVLHKIAADHNIFMDSNKIVPTELLPVSHKTDVYNEMPVEEVEKAEDVNSAPKSIPTIHTVNVA